MAGAHDGGEVDEGNLQALLLRRRVEKTLAGVSLRGGEVEDAWASTSPLTPAFVSSKAFSSCNLSSHWPSEGGAIRPSSPLSAARRGFQQSLPEVNTKALCTLLWWGAHDVGHADKRRRVGILSIGLPCGWVRERRRKTPTKIFYLGWTEVRLTWPLTPTCHFAFLFPGRRPPGKWKLK